ncbi:hypothetical protein [Nocardiopsis halophila]|uniref:hypothetical protein n=1 Tax=Nocardiopsis halophila TaxID=141692 RepID=UPI0003457D41|nr:hypothetical protein [Nocardiopsis halophila]
MKRIKKGAATLLVAAAATSGAFLATAPAGADTAGTYGPPNDTRLEQKDLPEPMCEYLADTYTFLSSTRDYWCVTSNPPKMNLMSRSK